MSLINNLSKENRKCRLCLCKSEVYVNIFEASFKEMIFDLTSIEISTHDGYPSKACINCIEEVQQATKTKNRIIESHRRLQEMEMIELKELQTIDPKYSKVVILDECSDDLGALEEISHPVSNPRIQEILSNYEDFVEEDRLNDFVVKGELITDSNDMTYYDHSDGSNTVEDKHLEQIEVANHPNLTKPILKLPQNQFNNIVLGAITKLSTDEKGEKKTERPPESTYKKLFCDNCNLDFEKDKYAYYLHMLKHKKSKCKICGIVIRSDNMSKHLDCHNSGPRVCDLCGATCKNIESLRGHIFYMHKKTADQYKCDQCNRSYRMKYKLELHKTKEHIGIRGHICGTCKKAFFTVRDLNSHIKMTHLKLRPHVCPHCEKGFSSKYALKTHMRQHTNETPYKCFVCGEGFRQNVSLRTHLKSKHNIEEAKDFACEFCDKAFHTEFALKVHLRLHSDDNYKCEHCEECFQQKVFLVNHLKSAHNVTEKLVLINGLYAGHLDT